MDFKSINFEGKNYPNFPNIERGKIIAQMNNCHLKVVKFQGEFVWHSHDDTDGVPIVLDGEMAIAFRDGSVELRAGEMFVVPRGVEHKPFAEKECKAMLVEPAGTINTGGTGGEMTAENDVWI